MAVHIREEIVGVPRSVAAHVVGVSERRLTSWNVNGMIKPSSTTRIGSKHIWTFSFEDLVQGRVLKELEDRGAHVLVVKRLVEQARQHGFQKPLAELRWAVGGAEVYVQYPDESWVGNRRPNQLVIRGMLDLEEIRSKTRAALSRSRDDEGKTERRRGSMGHQEVFAGTRLPVTVIVKYLQQGFDDRRILTSFPSLTLEDLDVAKRRLRIIA